MEKKGQSILGTFSLWLALLPLILVMLVSILAALIDDPYYDIFFFAYIVFFYCSPSVIIALVTGIAGILQKKRRREFAFWGTAVSVSYLLILVSSMYCFGNCL